MDNLTHTLIGTLLGETVSRTTRADEHGLPAELRRNLLVTLAAVGSNLPDADLLYSYYDGKIGYLLQHRGHSHTLLGALVLGALTYAVTLWWLRRRKLTVARVDRRWILATLGLTLLLHIAMDFTNNYGVHPFWPIYNGWLYGDAVFIVEPLLWAACAPLFFLLGTRAARLIVALILALGIGLSWFSGLVAVPAAVALSALVAAMLVLGHRARAEVAVASAIGVWLSLTAIFLVSAHVAGKRATALSARLFPDARLLDHVATPMPANPLCREVILVQTEAERTVLRRGMLTLAPALIDADHCLSRSFDVPTTAPLRPVPAAGSAEMKWFGQVSTPTAELKDIVRSNCTAAAAMRFIRAPWLSSVGGATVLADLRYDREPELGFAEIALLGSERCPLFVPGWEPPRADLLK